MGLKRLIAIIAILSATFYGCNKDNTISLGSEGEVVNRADSVFVSFADIVIYHWDGNKKSDTVILLKVKSDTLGKFDISFNIPAKYDFYWATAEKEGYENSSWGQLDGGSTNYSIIKLDKKIE